MDDVEKVIGVGCLRSNDTDKIRTLVRLLATTGLRLTEAASLRKDGVDFKANELRIIAWGLLGISHAPSGLVSPRNTPHYDRG